MFSIRLLKPHVVSRTGKRSPNKNVKPVKLDTKRFKEATGVYFYDKGVSENRYLLFTPEQKQERITQVKERRNANPYVRKAESKQQLIRRAKKLNLMRTCSQCKEEKTYAEFDRKYEKRLSRYVLRSYCTECRKVMNRKHYAKRKEQHDTSRVC